MSKGLTTKEMIRDLVDSVDEYGNEEVEFYFDGKIYVAIFMTEIGGFALKLKED